jgi:phosphoserine aminotransferase
LEEARREGETNIAWDGKPHKYDRLPEASELRLTPDAAYVHFTANETIEGVQFPTDPDFGSAPLVCDSSSEFLWRPMNIERYGLIYACAQKNAGPAGVTVVIMHESLLERSSEDLPGMLNYNNYAAEKSLYNTPPTFGIYVVNLVCKWLLEEIGGLEKMQELNQAKARLLYEVLDASDGFYKGHAQPKDRSVMNVTFRLPTEELEKVFISAASKQDLDSLKGHRSVGGIRASIYNAMPMAGVEALRDFMLEFRQQHAK